MRTCVIKTFGGPEVLEIVDTNEPIIKKNQLAIKVEVSSINPIDWKQRKGNHRFILGSPFPITLGYDVCGVVLYVGNDVKKFKVGDRVLGVLDNKYGGAYSEIAVGTEKCFVLVPESVSSIDAAAIPMVGLTALQALRDKANLKKSQKILINGASGGVGHIAVQMAKLMGAHVTVVASKSSAMFLAQFNPDEILNYDDINILELSSRFDVFFDVAGTYSYVRVKHLLNSKGLYLNTLPRPKILLHKTLRIFNHDKRVKTLLMKHNPEDLKIVVDWMVQGKLKVVIDRQFKLSDISNAHKYAQKGHSKGKNVILINN